MFQNSNLTVLPHIIYIDFSLYALEVIDNKLLICLQFLKKNKDLGTFVFAGLYKDKHQLTRLSNLWRLGQMYSFIKGEELHLLILDTFYCAFNESCPLPQYARATKINLPFTFNSLCAINFICEDGIEIETDTFGQNDHFIIKFPFIENLFRSEYYSFPSLRPIEISYNHDFTYTCYLKFPFPGPWDDITEESFLKDTFLTWYEEFKKQLTKIYFKVLTIRAHSLEEEVDVLSYFSSLCKIYFNSNLDSGFNIIETMRPDLIIFSLTPKEEENENEESKERVELKKGLLPNDPQTLARLANFINSKGDYFPIIVVLNTESSTSSLQNALDYKNILGTSQYFNSKLIQHILNIFYKNLIKKKKEQNLLYFPNHYPKIIGEIQLQGKVLSLTEHELCFLSPSQLPYYSVCKLYEPCELFITIIPAFFPTPGLSKEGHFYYGIIHGVDEEDKQILRQFVNQLIFHPSKEFKFIKVDPEENNSDQNSKTDKNEKKIKDQTKLNKKENKNEQIQTHREQIVRKIAGDRKSKL